MIYTSQWRLPAGAAERDREDSVETAISAALQTASTPVGRGLRGKLRPLRERLARWHGVDETAELPQIEPVMDGLDEALLRVLDRLVIAVRGDGDEVADVAVVAQEVAAVVHAIFCPSDLPSRDRQARRLLR